MNVKVQIELSTSATQIDQDEMREAAGYCTDDERNIVVYIPEGNPKTIVAEFTIPKARQMDVVDGIYRRFSRTLRHYGQSSISFPKTSSKIVEKPKSRYTPKQGQYLAFIYYYTKLNGRPPAEADIQRYFKTTPPTVHNMIVQLEKKGFIQKKPYEPRSIRLLLSPKELPDLE
jgi:DNA-binding MarR family transcriptional regulator